MLRGKGAELVLDRNNLVRTLLARLDNLAVLVRDVVPGLEYDAPLSLLGVAASRVCEFKRRGAPELKENVHFVAFVNVHARVLTTADLHAGKGMDRLGNVDGGTAFAGLIRDARNDELAGLLSNTPEAGSVRPCVPLAVEVVSNVEWWRAREGVGDALADAVILARLQRVYRRGIVQLNLYRGPSHVVLSLAAPCVSNSTDEKLLVAKAEMLSWNRHAKVVGLDGGDPVRFRG